MSVPAPRGGACSKAARRSGHIRGARTKVSTPGKSETVERGPQASIRIGLDPLLADFLENLGTLENGRGDQASSLRDLQAAADILNAEAQPDLDELGAINGNIGYTYIILGRVTDAVRHLRKGIDGRTPGTYRRLAGLGYVDSLVTSYNRLGDYDEALHYAKFGLERAGQWLPPGHIGFAYFNLNAASVYLDTGRQAYALMTRARVAQGDYAAAPVEIDRVFGLLDGMLTAVSPGRLDAESLRALILARLAIVPPFRTAFSRLADVATATGHPAEAFRRRAACLVHLDQRLAALRRAFPGYDDLTRPAPLDHGAARAGLRKEQALLLPVQSDDWLTKPVLNRTGLIAHAAPLRQRDALRALPSLPRAGMNWRRLLAR